MNYKLLLLCVFFCLPIWAQKSLFSSGTWYKVQIQKDDIYTLNTAFFKKYKIDLAGVDPRNVHIYGGQIGELPQANDAVYSDALVEIPVWCNDDNGKFETKDFVKFYGAGPNQKSYEGRFINTIHTYDAFAYYFIKIDNSPAKKITIEEQSFANAEEISRAIVFEYEEKELKNILASGRQWFGDFFYDSYGFKKPIISPNSQVNVQISIMGVGRLDQRLDIFNADKKVFTDILAKSTYNSSDTYDRYNRYSNVSKIDFSLPESSLDLTFKLATAGSANSGAYIDNISYHYTRKITAVSKSSTEYWIPAEKRKNINLKLDNFDINYSFWDISKPLNPQLKKTSTTNLIGLEFKADAARFLIVDNSVSTQPLGIERMSNQDILSYDAPEMLIIYPPKYKNEAEKLAIHKRTLANLETIAISSEDIYNVYSGGKMDPSAIRNYCRSLWKKNPSKFKFLLLFGDATFDYKNANNANYVNAQDFIPTYQSRESLEPIYSFCSDDYFGFLEDAEGQWEEGYSQNNNWISNTNDNHTLDIAIGRLPVKNIVEAQQMVNKIIKYAQIPKQNWDTKLSMVADNRDYNIHTDNAENLSSIVKNQYGGLEISKIYIDAFEVNKAVEAPDATKALIDNIEKGTFLLNYVGHGSEGGWAQEKLLTLKEILAFKNTKWPIFFTATCQFGKFDNPNLTSGAELALLLPNTGAIAFLTTTRPVYASTNEKINQAFYRNIDKYPTLGEVFKVTKNLSQAGEVNRNFSLLGDPSLPMPNWKQSVILEKINGKIPLETTMRPIENYVLEGKTNDIQTGKIYIEILDKPLKNSTKGAFPDESSTTFQTQTQLIYKGETEVKNGRFVFNIRLPKTQLEGQGKGLMKFRVISTDSISSVGFFDDFLINSEIQNQVNNTPPVINYSISEKQDLIFEVKDDIGIYTGRQTDIVSNQIIIDDTLSLDVNAIGSFGSEAKILNVNRNLNFLSPGKHKLEIIIFDIHNNKAEIAFELNISKQKIEIQNLVIYPNPIQDYSYLILQHNRPQEDLTAVCSVYDLHGRLLKKITNSCTNCDKNWDFGLDFASLKNVGAELIYKMELISRSDLSSTFVSGRLLVLK